MISSMLDSDIAIHRARGGTQMLTALDDDCGESVSAEWKSV
jgi:hypothetical protein